jgi:hypothetical protein
MTGRVTSSGSSTQARTESITRSMMVSMPNSSVLSWVAMSCSCRFLCASCARSSWGSLIEVDTKEKAPARCCGAIFAARLKPYL